MTLAIGAYVTNRPGLAYPTNAVNWSHQFFIVRGELVLVVSNETFDSSPLAPFVRITGGMYVKVLYRDVLAYFPKAYLDLLEAE